MAFLENLVHGGDARAAKVAAISSKVAANSVFSFDDCLCTEVSSSVGS